MSTTKVQVSDLTTLQLNWAVAMAEGKDGSCEVRAGNVWYERVTSGFALYSPSVDWAQGGPIIDREKINLSYYHHCAGAFIYVFGESKYAETGDTSLQAAMRCYVASKFGSWVEVPNELVS